MANPHIPAIVDWLAEVEKAFGVVADALEPANQPLSDANAENLQQLARSFEREARERRAQLSALPPDSLM